MLSYLRLVASDSDDLAFRRIINLPARKFGEASLKALTKIAEEESISLMEALRQNIDNKPFNKPSLHLFLKLIDDTRSRIP